MRLKACRHRFRRNIRHGLQQLEVPVQIDARFYLMIYGKRPDDFFLMDHRNTDKCDIFRVLARFRPAKELPVFGDVGNHARQPGRCNLSGHALADLVGSPLHFLLGESVGSLDQQGVAVHQRKRSAQQPHFPVQNIQNRFQKDGNIPLMHHSFADAVQDCDLKIIVSTGCHNKPPVTAPNAVPRAWNHTPGAPCGSAEASCNS